MIAEVYLLVYYLPTSFARSLGKQIEIVALIEIRSVFKDLDNTSNWPWEAAFFPHLLSAMVLGGALVWFYHLLPRRVARIEEQELARFVDFKTALAGLLSVALVGLSVYSLGAWVMEIATTPDHLHSDLNSIFYNEFFTALILVDVLLLVVSFRYSDDFGLVLRNSGFVVATILLRRALGHRAMARLGLRMHRRRARGCHGVASTGLAAPRARVKKAELLACASVLPQ